MMFMAPPPPGKRKSLVGAFLWSYAASLRLWRSLGESNPCFSLERAAS
jgi:hypothetical protein